MIKIVADENIDAPIIAWLRTEGHDAPAIAEASSGIDEREILPIAAQQDRIVLTFDFDFGELAVRRGLPVSGVVLRRVRSHDRAHHKLPAAPVGIVSEFMRSGNPASRWRVVRRPHEPFQS